MNDIDLSSIDNWEPIGNATTKFTGIFDGNGHVIKNLKIDRPDEDYMGLFGKTDHATIKNIGLDNVNISGQKYVGALIGRTSGTTISNCYAAGNVSGNENTGGLIGVSNTATISNCYVTGNVSGNGISGGLVGFDMGSITNCYVSGAVTGNGPTTGLICGSAFSQTITNVWADKKDSALGAFGQIFSGTTITNSNAVSHKEFTSPEFWDSKNFDSDVWEMSCHIPPILKNVGGFQGNWYFRESSNEFRFQVGSGSDPAANAMFVNTGLDLGAINVDLSTVEGCLDASRCVKAALDAVTKRTTDIGIEQSRLETISNVNNTQIENLSAAYSTVTEADVAEEVARYTKAQIMAQAASSLITQTQNFQANLLMRMINSLG